MCRVLEIIGNIERILKFPQFFQSQLPVPKIVSELRMDDMPSVNLRSEGCQNVQSVLGKFFFDLTR